MIWTVVGQMFKSNLQHNCLQKVDILKKNYWSTDRYDLIHRVYGG